jgi:hypothetical protein
MPVATEIAAPLLPTQAWLGLSPSFVFAPRHPTSALLGVHGVQSGPSTCLISTHLLAEAPNLIAYVRLLRTQHDRD